MEDVPVDPRDAAWERDADRYRVYFWSPDGVRCYEHEVTGAPDVASVLAWAEEHADGRVLELFVCLVDDRGVGLVRLAGRRPPTP